ncbi:MAG: YbaK/EbsC family protein [Gammaproteobacteria bacterium]|nr:YbaK/EbsC family protein [Gammaproteobacteria bacterium]MDH3857536.1 YbaK/EbsC family protein [Gammaproteobacteria bacterium]
MKPANLKVKNCLERAGYECEIRILSDAVRTAQLAADALGCEVGQIANSLIFRDQANNEAVLIMCAGDRCVDLQKVRLETGIELGKADAEFVRQQTGFAIGGVPPVGHAKSLRTLLDDSLWRHAVIWVAAGTPESVFRMNPQQLQQITQGAWLDIAQD